MLGARARWRDRRVVRCEGDVPRARRRNSNERKEIKKTVGLKRTGAYDVQLITWMKATVVALARPRRLADPMAVRRLLRLRVRLRHPGNRWQ